MVTRERKRKRSTRNGRDNNIVGADRVGNTRVPSSVLDVLVHPDATPLHQIPQSDEEAVLSKVENLLGKGHYGAAIREAKALKIPGSPLAAQYEFLLQEKISRAYIGIADRYFIRGNKESAKNFFAQAIKPDTTNEVILSVAALAERTFEKLLTQRQGLFNGLVSDIKDNIFVDWCEKKNSLLTDTVIDTDTIREAISADFTMEDVLGDVPPISTSPGWVDPLPPETEFIDFTSVTPASVFEADTPKSVDVDVSITSFQDGDNRIRASVAMPIISNVLIAKARLFAIDRRLTSTGQAQGLVPIFRYEYLRDKAKEIIAHIKDIDSRMLPIQFKLDDFAELAEPIRRPLLEQTAELEAVNQKISELTQTHTSLAQVEKEMANVVILLRDAVDECDCDWWCWVKLIGTAVLSIAATIVAIALELEGLAGLLVLADIYAIAAIYNQITCENVSAVESQASTVLNGIRQSIQENEAELNYQLSVRDILIANITGLTDQLNEINASNQARLLNATTLNAIQAQYNMLRQSLLTRAQVMAKLTEEAFNFERDSKVRVIKSAYYDEDKKGYTAAETLLRDLEGLDYIDVTGRTRQKAMQLSHVVSLRKNYPMSFPSIPIAGRARFMATMKDFDHWFPGTYLQRIKEVRVEVLVEDKPVPARGYISNDGISFVRFSDTGNKIPVDSVDVFIEPDVDIAKLCFKRFERRRHIDTMAFPDFESYLHEERMRSSG
jgi:receptor-binding and translocation channel-forming TcA subunit of Tc toxin